MKIIYWPANDTLYFYKDTHSEVICLAWQHSEELIHRPIQIQLFWSLVIESTLKAQSKMESVFCYRLLCDTLLLSHRCYLKWQNHMRWLMKEKAQSRDRTKQNNLKWVDTRPSSKDRSPELNVSNIAKLSEIMQNTMLFMIKSGQLVCFITK